MFLCLFSAALFTMVVEGGCLPPIIASGSGRLRGPQPKDFTAAGLSCQQGALYQLKLHKRLLSQQLAVLDSRVQRVSKVLEEKRRCGDSTNNPLSQGQQQLSAKPERKGLRRRTPGASTGTFPPPVPYIKQLNTAAPVSDEILQRRQQQLMDEVRLECIVNVGALG